MREQGIPAQPERHSHMRVGVFGDIHGNQNALEAVLSVLDTQDCDQFVCTGDIVGYGPRPNECVSILRERQVPAVLGNHESLVTTLGELEMAKVSPDTRYSLQWTQGTLDMDALKWLAVLPMRLDYEGFSVIHGSFGPKPFAYVVNPVSMAKCFAYQDVPLAFYGHTHLPVIAHHPEEAAPRMDFVRKGTVSDDGKILLNPGAVGQPRDRDPRAACLVYDTETRMAIPIRVEYDIEGTQRQMMQLNLPKRLILRLAQGT